MRQVAGVESITLGVGRISIRDRWRIRKRQQPSQRAADLLEDEQTSLESKVLIWKIVLNTQAKYQADTWASEQFSVRTIEQIVGSVRAVRSRL